MATYPGGVFSPAAKNTGDVIQATHVTDLEAEVIALESALTTALAHALVVSTGGITVSTGGLRVSGASTLAAVNAGASTLASLSVSSGSTIAGGLTVTGGLTVDGAPVTGQTKLSVELTHGSSQTVTNNTWTGLSWDTETFDVGGLHSTAANSSRINLTSTGSWLVGACVPWEQNSTGQRRIQILLNDTTPMATAYDVAVAAPIQQHVTTRVRAASTTDYVTIRAWQNGSDAAVASVSTTAYRFWADWMSS